MPVITGRMAYPENAIAKLREKADVVSLDALSLAERAGSVKAVNTVLLGVLSRDMPEIAEDEWMEAIDAIVKPAFVELNKRAFRMGREA